MVDVLPRQFKTMLRDYRDSWSANSGAQLKRDRRRAFAFFYLIPTAAGLVFVIWHVELNSIAPYLTAVSVFTGLLFGLLILVFNTAITLRKDGSALSNAHNVQLTISDLRATIAYSIAVAIALVVVLAIATAFMMTDAPAKGSTVIPVPHLGWYWTPVLVWLAVHLVLNVGKILERIRTAFNYISR